MERQIQVQTLKDKQELRVRVREGLTETEIQSLSTRQRSD